MRLDLLRSRPGPRAGEALPGERCKPALISAAACSEDKDGDLGEDGAVRRGSAVLIEVRRGLCWFGDPGMDGGRDDGRELRSGAMCL